MESKLCRKCGVVKPLGDYQRNKSRADGRQSYCRECTNEANRAWHHNNRERARENARVWREVNRERHLANGRAWAEANRGRQRENVRAWQRANPDKCAAREHRRRARKSSAVPQRWTVDHTLGDPLACWWCGRGLLGTAVHTDHVMPISLGGPAETANEVMSCGSCNIRKQAKHPLVWIAELVS